MRHAPQAVMMFAAGFGTRMAHLTQDRPKPMVVVGGRPLIDHTLDLVRGVRPARIVANTHYLPAPLERHLAGGEVTLTHETPDILDTGGGLRNALPLLGPGPVWTTNTDAIWQGPNPFDLLRDAWQPEEMDALLITVAPARAVGHAGKGDFEIDADGRLTRGPGAIYGGVQIIDTAALDSAPDGAFSLNLIWDQLIRRGRLFGLPYPGRWCDVGHPEGVTRAEAMLDDRDV